MDDRDRLVDLVRKSPTFLDELRAVRSLGLASWCIGAGAVRHLVWDALHGDATPSPRADVDVAYFDEADLDASRDRGLEHRLSTLMPTVPWEVTNQAAVHRWFEAAFGHAVLPLRSLDEAVASWPETATAVGLTLRDDDSIDVIAPCGLHDLFALVVRRNPTRASVDTYRERIRTKRYAERWPRVRIIE